MDKKKEQDKEARYVIEYDRENCIGAGSCTEISKNWKMDDDGKASFVKKEITEDAMAGQK